MQLCLEGFYDKTPFHRILKGELAQGGDPTGTGNHSESVFGEPFKDEFHSRLRFSHRYNPRALFSIRCMLAGHMHHVLSSHLASEPNGCKQCRGGGLPGCSKTCAALTGTAGTSLCNWHSGPAPGGYLSVMHPISLGPHMLYVCGYQNDALVEVQQQ